MHLLTRRFLTQYTFTLVLFLCIDLTWIALVAKKMYINTLSPILAGQPAWVPALAFYFIYSFGLWFLAIKSTTKPQDAALKGSIVGLTAYGTYALTGQSLFAGWGWSLTFVDCAWGMVLSATVALLTTRFFGQKL